jgi:transcription antitermination factor NusG
MAASTVCAPGVLSQAHWPAECLQPNWYAAYTCARHEKRVAGQLLERSVEHFLPLYETVQRWKDRRVRLQLPLFPGYLFVRMALHDRLYVLDLPGVVRLVGFNGRPVAIEEAEIEAIRACVERKCRMEPHPFLQNGQTVRIISGALEGVEGILLRKKGTSRLVLSLGLIMRSVAVEIDASDVELLRSGQKCQNRQPAA